MVSQPVLTISLVDKLQTDSRPTGSPSTQAETTLTTLDEIKQVAGIVLVPRYLPVGFQLTESRLVSFQTHHAKFLTYEANEGRGRQSFDLGQLELAAITCKRGYASEITINGRPAYVIEGGWASVDGAPIDWYPNIARSVYCEADGGVAFVSSIGENRLDRTSMIQILESLAEY